jgi:hypothetical protein
MRERKKNFSSYFIFSGYMLFFLICLVFVSFFLTKYFVISYLCLVYFIIFYFIFYNFSNRFIFINRNPEARWGIIKHDNANDDQLQFRYAKRRGEEGKVGWWIDFFGILSIYLFYFWFRLFAYVVGFFYVWIKFYLSCFFIFFRLLYILKYYFIFFFHIF